MFDGIRQSNERLITASGLSIVGLLLQKTKLQERLNLHRLKDNAAPHIKNHEIVFAYIGLLCQGKSDFDHIREMNSDPDFYRIALGIDHIPSSETLRQRLDMAGGQWRNILLAENIRILKATGATLTPCRDEYIPLDIDVSPFDNSGTKKQGVARTYQGFDGYAPIFAYVGAEGYLVNTELRKGSQHCQNHTVPFLKETILQAKRLTSTPLLVRLDSGNDSSENIEVCREPETRCHFIIKRNLRTDSPQMWLDIAKENGTVTHPREGKTVYTGSVQWTLGNLQEKVRIVFRVIERTITADGQILLVPDLEVENWLTSLTLPPQDVIELYQDHGTCEQFHSEIKTDMDLERLPSGKFETNALILELAMLAYNILRVIGQESLKQNDSPLRKPVLRRRLRTVISNLVLIATRVVQHARKTYLNLGRSNAWVQTFTRVYEAFAF
ncbi:DDE family transposase [Hydrogenispora ethanolica]|uniref:DDE family transposase n=1 Tax=Hydrogenispora ethanolica TaxID=1082276 RepID=A0A4R1QIN5_HYDET|nr:IS1380 family transposase [Hydrogenispora ethanolica]TCL53458.1 DDE family transposase [Hydrogenispora ethanolica]